MSRVLLCSFLVLGFVGCGPRAEVAKDKIIAQIDKILGELDVKRKKIEVKRRALVKDMEDLRKSRISTGVRLEQLAKKEKSVNARMDKIVKDAAKLKERRAELGDDGKLERNGKEYTEDDLMALAQKLGKNAEILKNEKKMVATQIESLTRSFDFLKKQEATAKELMSKLEIKIEEIDSKKVAMDAIRKTKVAAGDQKSMSDRFEKLSEEIDGMFVDVESAMRLEEEKLTELQAETDSADELLYDPKSLDESMAELDAILGDK